MTDEVEVERLARLMHDAMIRHLAATEKDRRSDCDPWEAVTPRAQAAYLAVARAVIADFAQGGAQ